MCCQEVNGNASFLFKCLQAFFFNNLSVPGKKSFPQQWFVVVVQPGRNTAEFCKIKPCCATGSQNLCQLREGMSRTGQETTSVCLGFAHRDLHDLSCTWPGVHGWTSQACVVLHIHLALMKMKCPIFERYLVNFHHFVVKDTWWSFHIFL